jgi:hypothetical protein
LVQAKKSDMAGAREGFTQFLHQSIRKILIKQKLQSGA